jgi:hypothetical protein
VSASESQASGWHRCAIRDVNNDRSQPPVRKIQAWHASCSDAHAVADEVLTDWADLPETYVPSTKNAWDCSRGRVHTTRAITLWFRVTCEEVSYGEEAADGTVTFRLTGFSDA